MDMLADVENYRPMPSARQKQPLHKFYLSEWMARLGRRSVDLARHLNVGEPYISNLRSEKKANPSVSILLDISEWLGITVNDLFKPPPKASSIGDLQGYSQGAIEKLLSSKPSDRRSDT